MTVNILADFVPERKDLENRTSHGSMYKAPYPFCDHKNTVFSYCIDNDKDTSGSNSCAHLIRMEKVTKDIAAKFIFSDDKVKIKEVESTYVKVRNFEIDSAKVTERELWSIVNFDEYNIHSGNMETDRIGLTHNGEVTERGKLMVDDIENFMSALDEAPVKAPNPNPFAFTRGPGC